MTRGRLLKTLGRLVAAAGILTGVVLLVGNRTAAAEGEAPVIFVNPIGPPVSAEGIRVSWTYEGTGVYYFAIERESPYTFWASEDFVGHQDDTSLQRGRQYRYRVCAVYLTYRVCDRQGDQGWVGATEPLPSTSGSSTGGSAPLPAAVAMPVLTTQRTTLTEVYLKWGLPPSGSVVLTRGTLYRDHQAIYEALQPGNYDADYVDQLRHDTTYRYQFCFEGPAFGKRCSSEVVVEGPVTVPNPAVDPSTPIPLNNHNTRQKICAIVAC